MALAKVEILGGRRGADAISGTLASGTNILQDSLSEAVRSGRAMADLQQGQERDLLGERESVRNFHERKGMEEQRVLESTRDHGEKQWQFDETMKREDTRLDLLERGVGVEEDMMTKVRTPDSVYRRQIFNEDTKTWAGGSQSDLDAGYQANDLFARIDRGTSNFDFSEIDLLPPALQGGGGGWPDLLTPGGLAGAEKHLEDLKKRVKDSKLDLSGITDPKSIYLVRDKMTPEQLERYGPQLLEHAEMLARREWAKGRSAPKRKNPGSGIPFPSLPTIPEE